MGAKLELLILTALSFLIKWGLSKFSFFKSRKTLSYVVSGLISIITFVIYAVVFSYYITRIPQEKFDETIWVNNISERHKMIDNLLESEYFIGKDINDIWEVFGEPKEINKDKNVVEYELIGHHGLDFEIFTLRLHLTDSIVTSFNFESIID